MPSINWQEVTRHGSIVRLVRQGDHCIKVKENDQYRWLEINGIMQSLMKLNEPASPPLPPHQAISQIFPPTQGSGVALELGLGGGTMQRYFARHRPNWQLTSVEIDPLILELFREHFAPQQSNNKSILERAERIITRFDDNSVNGLIIDICTDEGLPEFLSDRYFWLEVERVLAPNPTVAVNLIPKDEQEWLRVTDLMRAILSVPLGWIQIPNHLNMLVVSEPETN
ncbi:SAM-dependent methyltransferase [Neiella marina]|uniref:SAM-dependent methyltransferase n=1 Tax=Neiella marina TaxID=508461 RepID=A0A8J2XQU5_9GAMM|nr:methyltransferase domain-containing protein [Neiella marina]GGA86461.1 SAM-dependent methyltransferase [Neiella marina]